MQPFMDEFPDIESTAARHWLLPAPIQICYIVPDMNAALLHWTGVVGAGPFFVADNIRYKEQWFRGQPTDADITLAIGYWGDMQIEFVQQRNDAPSPYRDFVRAGHVGTHHLGILSQSLESDLAELRRRGIERIYWGESDTGLRFAYVDSDRHPGGMIELIEAGPASLGLFQVLRDAARGWDGSDPIRRIG